LCLCAFSTATSLGQKRNLVQVEWGDKKVLYNTLVEGIAYENDKNFTNSEKQML
jgi:hypothetical protein